MSEINEAFKLSIQLILSFDQDLSEIVFLSLRVTLTALVISCIIGFLLSEKLMISAHDIFLGFVAGFFQIGFGFIFITIGARSTPSAMVGIIMLSESVLGPLWAFLFVGERVPLFTIIGGGIILFAVLLQFFSLFLSSNKNLKSP